MRALIHHSEVAGQTNHVRTKILLLMSTVQVDWSFPYFMYNCSICTEVVGFQQELSFQVYHCIVFDSKENVRSPYFRIMSSQFFASNM